ncbi:hypothetical protein BJV78DRAFT_601752 [Lactifluus subvellereus]|nr:hypothetical protein BJV78DRAFT_601752 [Lactifluus subvellereus]
MVSNTFFTAAIVLAVASRVSAHVSLWHPSMFGFNESTAPNRAQDPLMNLPFNEWWMHGLLDKPPHPEDIMQLPVGRSVTTELSCDKDSTSYWTSGPGGDQRNFKNPNSPCPGAKSSAAYHTNGINDLGGCALGVAYESDPYKIKPEDFTIFSVNQTCVWYRFTDFQIPKMMPKCPNEKCICAWFWIHRADSGSEQMFFTPFQCNMQDATSTTPLPPAQVARRCGLDPDFNRPANASNCTYGAKQPLYWYQLEGNNQFEDTYHPPLYNDLFHFLDGAQDDIFDPAYYNMSNLTSSSRPFLRRVHHLSCWPKWRNTRSPRPVQRNRRMSTSPSTRPRLAVRKLPPPMGTSPRRPPTTSTTIPTTITTTRTTITTRAITTTRTTSTTRMIPATRPCTNWVRCRLPRLTLATSRAPGKSPCTATWAGAIATSSVANATFDSMGEPNKLPDLCPPLPRPLYLYFAS